MEVKKENKFNGVSTRLTMITLTTTKMGDKRLNEKIKPK